MEYRSSQHRVSRWWFFAGVIVLMLGIVYAWRLKAPAPLAPPASSAPAARGAGRLPQLPVLAQSTDNEAKDMGGTFYFLESRARKVTTRFGDGVAIAERSLDGNIKTRSTDLAGNETGKLTVDQVGARDAEMLYEANGAQLFYAPVRPEVRPTLDWATLQAQALRRDGHPSTVQWQGRFARARGLRPGNLDDGAAEVVTEFDQGITAQTVRVVPKPGENKRPSTLTRLYDGGVEVGEMAWVPSQRLLMWNFKGLSKGAVNEETLKKTPAGGWTFQPSMGWANVQALAFYAFHSRLAREGTASAARNQDRPRPWVRRLLNAVVQPVEANAPGCDGLHWLDGTVYRPCCDSHDLCYAKVGCSQWSWFWPPSMSWSCTVCNSVVAYCFYSTFGAQTGTCIYMPGACFW
jgi:hypothetical protein